MSVTIKQTHTNEKWLGAIKQRHLKNYRIETGFPAKAGTVRYPSVREEYDTGGSPPRVVDVAVKNEFGIGVPARPFMKLSREGIRIGLQSDIRKQLKRFNRGDLKPQQLVEKVAPKTADVIKRTIVQLSAPPNSKRTIEIKKSSNPLIDSGLMRQTVSWEVTVDKGDVK